MFAWLTNLTFVAQMAHVGWGVAIMEAAKIKGMDLPPAFISLAMMAALKEFWFDIHFEMPRQTYWNSALDFTCWIGGALLGVWICLG